MWLSFSSFNPILLNPDLFSLIRYTDVQNCRAPSFVTNSRRSRISEERKNVLI